MADLNDVWYQLLFVSVAIVLLILICAVLVNSLKHRVEQLIANQERILSAVYTVDRKTIVGNNTANRIEAANESVATDLKDARLRADKVTIEDYGAASDAAARSQPKD